MFNLNPSLYGSVFVIPTEIVDKYIKLASPLAIKTLLWILRNQGGNFSAHEIAESIGSSKNDVNEALEYWTDEGILLSTDSKESAKPLKTDTEYLKKETVKDPVQKGSKTVTLPEIQISKPTLEQITKRIEENDEIRMMLNEAQVVLGRTIGLDTQSTLLMMHDTYGLKLEVILTLLQFCAGSGKASTSYIAKLSKVWAEKEINTLALANEYIEKYSNANHLFTELKIVTGLSTPQPTGKQADYLVSWNDMGFNVDMISLAFEETSERTGKISFNYMNKILLNWNNSGFRTPSDIENAKKQFKESKAPAQKNSYSLEKANEMAQSEPIKYVKKKDR